MSESQKRGFVNLKNDFLKTRPHCLGEEGSEAG